MQRCLCASYMPGRNCTCNLWRPDDVDDLNKIVINESDLTVIHINISCLALHIDKLKLFLSLLALVELVNKLFQSGTFLDIFKIAKVIPSFKSESQVLCNNYRPIYLLSNISKLIEKLINKQLNNKIAFIMHNLAFTLVSQLIMHNVNN